MNIVTYAAVALSELREQVKFSKEFDMVTLSRWSFGGNSASLISKNCFITACICDEQPDDVNEKLDTLIPENCFVDLEC